MSLKYLIYYNSYYVSEKNLYFRSATDVLGTEINVANNGSNAAMHANFNFIVRG